MNDTTASDPAVTEAVAPVRRVNRETPPEESPSSPSAKRPAIAWRALVTILCDLVIGGGGAALLWFGGNTTIADGHFLNYVVFVLAVTVLLIFRHLATGRRGFAAASVAEVRVDQIVTFADLALLAAICGAWMATGDYFLGWIAVFSAIVLLLATALQLMLDVLSGRNSLAQEREGSLFGSRILALEVFRIALGVAALAVIVVGAEIHEWNPAILNLTVLLAVVPMGLSTLVAAARNRR